MGKPEAAPWMHGRPHTTSVRPPVTGPPQPVGRARTQHDGRTQGTRPPEAVQALQDGLPQPPALYVRAPLCACSSLTPPRAAAAWVAGPGVTGHHLPLSQAHLLQDRADPGSSSRSSPPWAHTRVHGEQGSLGGPAAPRQGQAGISRGTARRHQRPPQQGWGGNEGGQTSRGCARGPEGLGLQEAVLTHQTSV